MHLLSRFALRPALDGGNQAEAGSGVVSNRWQCEFNPREWSHDMFRTGFLGYQTTFMLDFVVVALALIVPLLLLSLWLVRFRRRYVVHMRLQLMLGVVLLVAVGAFEIDVQMVHGGWQNIVAQQTLSPDQLQSKIADVRPWLYVHLVFAISTPFLWLTTTVYAVRRFGWSPTPGPHSRLHQILGWASTADITMTSVTGLLFYYVAFVR